MLSESMIVVANGGAYTGWTSATVSQDFDSASGECTLEITEQPGQPLPLNLNDDVQVIIGGRPVITGYVYSISGQHSFGTHTITLTIRDQTQSFIDSTVGPGVEFQPEVAVKDVLSGTLSKMGLSHIGVIDKVNPDKYKPGGEVPVAAVNDTGFNWLDKWTSKRNVLLNTDGKGNLVIDRNQEKMGPFILHKGPQDDPLNNVLEASFNNSLEGRHNQKQVAGQKSTNDLKHWEGRPKDDPPAQANPLSKNWGIAKDITVRADRKQHLRGGQGIEGKTPEDAARWRANLAQARNLTYDATVQGFSMNGELWWPGFLVPVFDYHFQISNVMFIKGVEFKKDWQGGSKTSIKCTVKSAYSNKDPDKGGRGSKRGLGTKQGADTKSGDPIGRGSGSASRINNA